MRKCDLAPIWIMLLLSIAGCMSQSQHARETAQKLATSHGFSKVEIKTDRFLLTTYQKFSEAHQPLRIYIEGDGRNLITRSLISKDPTPSKHLALKLAMLDPISNVAYLARPCQFTPQHLDPECNATIWSSHRFSESVIQSMNQAIDQLKLQAKASKIHLVGFSGGAAVAVLIAARRNDIATLSTVAGDLDPVAMAEYHQTTPLSGSLNPKTVLSKLINLPQHHFSGEKDPVVPSFIAITFVEDLKKLGCYTASQMTILGATHHQGWEKAWPQLLNLPFY